MQNFEINTAMASFFTLEDAARLYVKAMDTWRLHSDLLGLKSYMIRYESIVDNFDAEISGLLNYLDVEWDPSVKEFYSHASNRHSIRTPSYVQVTKPLYNDSIYRWRNYASRCETMKDMLDAYVRRWGYGD